MLKNYVSAFHFFYFNCSFGLFFLSMMTNNQTKCDIIYKKLGMRAGDDERIINYEWSKISAISV